MMPVPPVAGRPASGADAAATPADFLSPRAGASPASAASVAPAQQVTPFAPTDVDSSSPEAFIRSVAPYAARVSKATGIPAAALIGMAANETGYGKYASHNNLFGIKGTGPAGSFSTPTWEDYGNGRVNITDNFRAYHSPAESFIDFADLVETSPRYKGAVGQTTVEGFVNGLRQGGYMTDPDYVAKISAITTRYSSVIDDSLRASGAAPLSGGSAQPVQTAAAPPASTSASTSAAVARPGAGVVVPDQFHIGLAPDEAMAACGPVAAIAFAQVYGRNPTPAEAMDLAKQSGWTAAGGMNGISNEKRLLDKMGLPSQLEMGANWDHIRADAVQHQPVIVSTPGHYFVIDGYDPNTGAYHVGQSGKVYRGGSDWMTPSQIQGLAGAPSGALYTVHPLAGQQAQVLPPVATPAGQQRQVLPPLPVASTQREVLPPLDLGNTPPPPPISSSPSPVTADAPPPPVTASPPPPSVSPSPPAVTASAQPPAAPDEPPPTLAPAAAASDANVAADPASLLLSREEGSETASAAATPAQADPPGPATVAPVAIHDVPPAAASDATLVADPASLRLSTQPGSGPPSAAATQAYADPSGPAIAAPAPPAQATAEPAPENAADAAPLAPPDDPTLAQLSASPADIARPGLVATPAMAIGAVAVGSQRQPPPPPPPPRRRPEDDELVPNG
jgi:flagellar protein FlgJ